jgi:hypothetical protein
MGMGMGILGGDRGYLEVGWASEEGALGRGTRGLDGSPPPAASVFVRSVIRELPLDTRNRHLQRRGGNEQGSQREYRVHWSCSARGRSR